MDFTPEQQEHIDNIISSRLERQKQVSDEAHLAEIANIKAEGRLHIAASHQQVGDVKDFLSLAAARAAAEDVERAELLKIHGPGAGMAATKLYRENRAMFDATKRRAQELGVLPKPLAAPKTGGKSAFRPNNT